MHSVLLFALSFTLIGVAGNPFGISTTAQAQTALRPPVHIPPRFPVNDPGVPLSLNGQSNSTQYIHSGSRAAAGGRISDATLAASRNYNTQPQPRVAQRPVDTFDSRVRYGGVAAKRNIGNIFGPPPRDERTALSRRPGLQDKITSAFSSKRNRDRGQQAYVEQPLYSDGYPIETIYESQPVIAQQPTLIDRRQQSRPMPRQTPMQPTLRREPVSSPVRSIPDRVPEPSVQTAARKSVIRQARQKAAQQAVYRPRQNSLREIQTASHTQPQFADQGSLEPGGMDYPVDNGQFDIAPPTTPQFRGSDNFNAGSPVAVQANPPRSTTRDFDFDNNTRLDDRVRSTVDRYSGSKQPTRSISILRSGDPWQDGEDESQGSGTKDEMQENDLRSDSSTEPDSLTEDYDLDDDLNDDDLDLDDDLGLDELSDEEEDVARPPVKTCEQFRAELLNDSIRDIALDISPPGHQSVVGGFGLARTWTDQNGNTLTSGSVVDIRRGYLIVDSGGGRVKIPYARLSDQDLAAVAEYWRTPTECSVGRGQYVQRSWVPQTFTWTASSLCHKPLYFENVQLERYGHSAGPFLQPVQSTVHFFSRLLFLPYNTSINPPNECRYALGYYRPGNCAPWLRSPVPLSLDGAKRQAEVVGGLIAIIP